MSAELDKLLSAGVIERIDASPWVSPIVVTMKKTGDIRMCVDLPHMEKLLTALAGATIFSTIDLESAYHQVPLHPESRDLTAFITHEGLFRFCRVPYGLASALSVFQKMMECIHKGAPNVQNYLDDVICFRRTETEHDAVLNTVLNRLKEADLRLNEQKCQFRQKSLRFLGHLVITQGVQPDTEHLQAIVQAQAPKYAPSLHSFLGMLSWFRGKCSEH